MRLVDAHTLHVEMCALIQSPHRNNKEPSPVLDHDPIAAYRVCLPREMQHHASRSAPSQPTQRWQDSRST